MSWRSPATLFVQFTLVILIAICLVGAGIVIDRSADTSPKGVLISLIVAIIVGTIVIIAITMSSFSASPVGKQQACDAEKPARDDSRSGGEDLA